MLSLLEGLKQTQTKSALGMRAALSSQYSSVTKLLQVNLMYQHYLSTGGRNGPLGLPTSEVQFNGQTGVRQFRGGEIQILGNKVHAIRTFEVSIRFLGFRCIDESSSDQSSPHDEPYFVISVDNGSGAPVVKKFGKYEGVDTGTEMGVGDLIIQKIPPNPMALRVMAYEQDYGDPDETARKIQEEVVKLSQEAGKLASAAEAADGPGIGPAAGAGTVGGIVGGPIGALAAAGVVSALGLGDDFVGQQMTLLFPRSEDVSTPSTQGMFGTTPYNTKIFVQGGGQGSYDLFFDVLVEDIPPHETVGGGS